MFPVMMNPVDNFKQLFVVETVSFNSMGTVDALTFRPTLFWHGRPSQQLLSSCLVNLRGTASIRLMSPV